MKSEVLRIFFIIQNLSLNETFSASFFNNTTLLSEKNKMTIRIYKSVENYKKLSDFEEETSENIEMERYNLTYSSSLNFSFGLDVQPPLKYEQRSYSQRFISKRNLLFFTDKENSSSVHEIPIVNEYNGSNSDSVSLVNSRHTTPKIGLSDKKYILSIVSPKSFHHIYRGVINFNKTDAFINKTVTNETKKNFFQYYGSISMGRGVLIIPLNNQSSDNWYTTLVNIIDIESILNTPVTYDLNNSNLSVKLNSTEKERFDNLLEQFDCAIEEEHVVLNISCIDVDLYLIADYLPNSTIVLDLSYGNQIKLLQPLFPHLKNLKSLTLSHNHHRYITRAFMGLVNLETLDLSDNDIMVVSNAFSYVPKLRSLNLSSNEIRRIRTISNAIKYLENLENLTLNNNVYINHIEKQDLYYLKKCNISLLSLFNTTLQNIENGSFSFLPNLKILEISVNYLNEEALANVTCGIGENVEFLFFGHMLRIKEFPLDALNCLKNSKVKELRLWYNYFNNVPVLPNFPYLKTISLSNCSIKEIAEDAFQNIPNIEIVFLRGNKLTHIPHAVSSSKNLKDLFIESQDSDIYDRFFIHNYVFKNLTFLKRLGLSRLRTEKLSRYNLNGLNSLQHLFLSQAVLYNIEDYSFETLTSLELLDLRGNAIKFLTNYTFYGLNKLKFLYLFGNSIKFADIVYPFHFSPLLTAVLLQYNEIQFLPEGMFSNQKNLKMLILGRNKLIPWTKPMFHPKAKVQIFDLSQNNIDYVSATMLEEFNQVTQYLDIGKNPFNCSKCGMKEFREFCLASNISLKLPVPQTDDNVYNCMNPQPLQNKNFFEVQLPEVECVALEMHILNLMVIILICFLMLLFTGLTIFCYIFRWYIRYWIFQIKINVKRKTSHFREKNYMYDCFIIYSSCDTAWVVNYLIPALENQEPHYKLCIHQRDFQVGRQITENILEAIENSRKVILVLTEGFIKSEWCMYELHLAQHKLFGDTRDILILVKLREIDRALYSKNLSYIEKTRRCFMWTDSHIGQKLFWNQIRKQLGQSCVQNNFQIDSKC